jgi:outer membrane lipoprotein-sorting protein
LWPNSENRRSGRVRVRLAALLLVSAMAAGCAVSRKQAVPPGQIRQALEAARPQLVAAYNRQAGSIRTITATVRMRPVTGSAYSGVIEQYHEFGGFLLASRPAWIRIIGQAPVVGKDIFDMVSDGHTFRIFIPSKNEFLVGPTNLERPAKNPVENLRPQHILDALFWAELPASAPVLFEQADAPPNRFYVLTLLRGSGSNLEIARKVWFDRSDLRVSRIEIYGPGGQLDSDITYSDWQPGEEAPPAASPAAQPTLFPREIHISRRQQGYQIGISISKLALNAPIPPDHFVLAQPPGTKLVHVGEEHGESEP